MPTLSTRVMSSTAREKRLTWKVLSKLAGKATSNKSLQEQFDLGWILSADKTDWNQLLLSVEKWEQCAVIVDVVWILASLNNLFPKVIGNALKDALEEQEEEDGCFFFTVLKQLQQLVHSRRDSVVKDSLATFERIAYLLDMGYVTDIRLKSKMWSAIAELEVFPTNDRNTPERPQPSSKELKIEEVLKNSSTELKPNLVKGPYSSTSEYTSTQYNLLREDFFESVRKALANDEQTLPQDVFHNHGQVEVLRLSAAPCGLQLSLKLLSPKFNKGNFDWTSSKLLLSGSLLAIRINGIRLEPIIWATVASDHSEECFKKGVIFATVLSSNQVKTLQVGSVCHLHECKAYFEAYRPALEVLSRLSSLQVPFERYLTEVDCMEMRKPKYLREQSEDAVLVNASQVFNSDHDIASDKQSEPISAEEVYREIMSNSTSSETSPARRMQLGNFLSISDHEKTRFDASQWNAFKKCLSMELSLVQGPPGTGKSFVGTALVSFMLDNPDVFPPPLVVVCYTNRALDAFLNPLLKRTRKLIRLGSRSGSQVLESHNLSVIRRAAREGRLRDASFHRLEKQLLGERQAAMDELDKSLTAPTDFDESTEEMVNEVKIITTKLEELQDLESLRLLKRTSLVGLTVTGAAKNARLLRGLGAKIFFIEESAQILESNLLAALPSSCEHLIMIGDHQQLRPKANNYRLEKSFHLCVSLFERLILNGFSYVRLNEQLRMRPEISSLVSSLFYPHLKDHPLTARNDSVSGVSEPMYFVTHSFSESESFDRSKSNDFEAQYVLSLAEYLTRHGYGKRKYEIVILTTYIGQMNTIVKMMTSCFPSLSSLVSVNVVDNFQGEEGDIVLLSLVRSGGETVGFLDEDSRVCVALSRARKGLYVVGDLQTLSSKSKVWASLGKLLEDSCRVGEGLLLKCPFHPQSTASAREPNDFSIKFCLQSCATELVCGHQCQELCHLEDKTHTEEFRCGLPCPRTCPEGHSCEKKCYERCYPCPHRERVKLKCGHENELPCKSLRLPTKCSWSQQVRLECGHVLRLPCGSEEVDCPEKCDYVLPCGHGCDLLCHGGKGEHNRKCLRPCTLPRRGCRMSKSHLCRKLCYEECELCDVTEPIDLPCGHKNALVACHINPSDYECREKCMRRERNCGHPCKSFCYECGHRGCCEPCKIRSWRELNCGHKTNAACCDDITAVRCMRPCEKNLACGHKCPKLCYEECGPCDEFVTASAKQSSCGHATKIPCSGGGDPETASIPHSGVCSEICGKPLGCGHSCESLCTDCLSGKLHRPCLKTCQRKLLCGHICHGVCGLPCEPCKQRCPLQACSHSKCRAKCVDESCSLHCKEKCAWSCEHQTRCAKKCSSVKGHSDCVQRCTRPLRLCGHRCAGYCADQCPSHCPTCRGDSDTDKRWMKLPCGHDIGEEDFVSQLDEQLLGLPTCHDCATVVPYSHRYRAKLAERRKLALAETADLFFASKIGLQAKKKRLAEDVRGCSDDNLREFIQSRLEDKTASLTPLEVVNLNVRLVMSAHLTSEEGSDLLASVRKIVSSTTFLFGPDFAKALLELLAEEGKPMTDHRSFNELICFSQGKWRVCQVCYPKHIYFSFIEDKCQLN